MNNKLSRKKRKHRQNQKGATRKKKNIWMNWETRNVRNPKRNHLTLNKLDAIPYLDEHGNKIDIKCEREEQYVAHDFIEPNSTVLELGGRYGMVSAVINHKLEKPTHHVVVEPDNTVLSSLKQNKQSHQCHFRIVHGIVSNKPQFLSQNGYATQTTTKRVSDASPVQLFSIEDIQKKYKLHFDTLVADCEGCLGTFIEENKHFVIHQLKYIMFEADMPKLCDYSKIRRLLHKAGFRVVVKGFVSFWQKKQPTKQCF